MAITPTFWTTNAVLDVSATPGLTPPVTILPGSPGQSLDDPQVYQDAATLFPYFDGDNNNHPNFVPEFPANYATATGYDFMLWHSAHQLAYLKDAANHTTVTVPDDDGETVIDDDSFTAKYVSFADGTVAFLSRDGERAYVLNNLQPTDIARMPLDDQRALAALPAYETLIAGPYSLIPNSGVAIADPFEARSAVEVIVNTLRAEITASALYQAGERDRFLGDPSSRGELYHYLFLEQLDLMDLSFQSQAIFSLDRVDELVNDIRERFERFERYNSIATPTEGSTSFLSLNLNSTHAPSETINGTDTLASGRDLFLRVESTLWELAVQRSFTANTGLSLNFSEILKNSYDTANATFLDYGAGFAQIAAVTNPQSIGASRLDGAGLLATLMVLENYAQEAEAEARSEELNQINRLLQDYSQMQKMLNATLQSFQPVADTEDEDEEEELTLLNVGTISALNTTDFPDGIYIAAMFDTTASTAGNTGHPEEQYEDIPGYARPTEALASGSILIAYPKRVWDVFAQNLGEASKLLGQENQIRMDEVNQMSRAKNRSYDLASNTLNKLNSLLRAITDF